MSERSDPPALSLALRCVLDAAVESRSRTGLLTVLRLDGPSRAAVGVGTTPSDTTQDAVSPATAVPCPRSPMDDDPGAA
jgi:hypothetical protein